MGCLILVKSTSHAIFPSLLAADPLALAQETQTLVQAGIDTVHLDVMDNHYVPNLTYGPLVCKALRRHFPQIGIDVHLMVTPVDSLIQPFADAGATRITIHPEATLHLNRSLQLIRDLGCEAGLALNPATPIEYLTWCHHQLDSVLIMTVNPGFGGQTLIPEVIDKITQVSHLYPNLTICVDGGIGIHNIHHIAEAGASHFVVGSALFSTPDYAKTLQELRQALHP